METPKSQSAKKAGWIVWWIEMVVLIIGGIVWAYIGTHPGILGPEAETYKSVTNVLISLFVAWHVIIQILSYVAIDRLLKTDNYLWPIILIVVGFMGNYLYLIPGIWGLITNSNHKVDNRTVQDQKK